MNHSMLRLDGSQGEGGGQILRSALSLSACLGRSFCITAIRAGRKKPGLMRQHLTAAKAAATVCNAHIQGADIGSQALTFVPGTVQGGNYHFSVGTAGSAMLVLQTVLLPLVLAEQPTTLTIEGGTHNPFAPPFEYLKEVFLPLLHRMGANVRLELVRPGFYPAGGGEVRARIEPCERLQPLTLLERGDILEKRATVWLSHLPANIAQREIKVLKRSLQWPNHCFSVEEISDAYGPGNVVMATVRCEHSTEMFVGFGERGIRAETVANRVAGEVKAFLESKAPVGEHLADQLLLPLALAGGGEFITATVSRHTHTNADVINAFTGLAFDIKELGPDQFHIKLN